MFDILSHNIIIIWLVAGGLFIFLEAMAIPGVGFLFAGCAAITTGGLVQLGVIAEDQYVIQLAIFLSTSFAWAIILWIPLQRFHYKNKSTNFTNLVDDLAIVYKNPLIKGKQGEAKWSGTVMGAMLADNSPEEKLDEGTIVKIVSVSGNVLNVVKK